MKKLFFNMLAMIVFTGVLCVQAESNMLPQGDQVEASGVTSNEKESPNLEMQKHILRKNEKVASNLALVGSTFALLSLYKKDDNISKSSGKYFLLSFIPHMCTNYKLLREHSDYRSLIKVMPDVISCWAVASGSEKLSAIGAAAFLLKLGFDSFVNTYDLVKNK